MQAVNSDIIETSEKRTLRISPVVDTSEIQTPQCKEGLDTAPVLEMAPAERTLGISLADCEGAIEELSKAMVEGFSAAMDEVIENVDKSDGISAEIDEFFDEPDKNLWSDEYVCGTWASEKGESNIFMDSITNRLSFEEVVDDSRYLHGWLDRHGDGWQARLIFYDMDENPWYSHSGEEELEYVGDKHVCLLSEKTIETQIKFSDYNEWQPQSFNTVTLRINATGEYLLLELGAVLRLRMAFFVTLLAATRRHLQCWEWYSSSSEEMCRATDMGIHAWPLVKRDFESASSLT